MPARSVCRKAGRKARGTRLGLVILFLLGACSPATAPSTTTAETTTTVTSPSTSTSSTTTSLGPPQTPLDPEGSYAVIAFTNHVPDFGETEEGAANRPWSRLNATRNYITMTRLIAQHPVKVVLGFSPTLLRQLADYAAGQVDRAALLTVKPATELTPEDEAYIDDVFFQASAAQIDRFPRYREIAERKAAGRALSTSEYRDLQALFNLAWTSPLLLEEEPLLSLAARGTGFSEDDKATILEVHLEAVGEVLESLRSMWSEGAIELATTPLANPVLPLLVRNRMDEDAAAHIQRGAEQAAAVLGRPVVGLAPAGGLIDLGNAPAIAGAGYEWALLTGPEGSPPIRLTAEDSDLGALLSGSRHNDRVGLDYIDMDPNAAALDVVHTIADAIGGQPGGVVTLAADGTEPWGRYEDGGVAFLDSLFRQLAGATEFTTALPSDLLDSIIFEPGQYPELPRSYLSEPAELEAWARLGDTRRQFLRSRDIGTTSPARLEEAFRLILDAEDGEFYRWFGIERSSGEDDFYDQLFRMKLQTAWELLDQPVPDWTRVPLVAGPPVAPSRLNRADGTGIEVDNRISDTEWAGAGLFDERTSALIRRVHYTFTTDSLLLRVDFTSEVLGDSAPGFDLYLGGPNAAGSALTPLGNSIGFDADLTVAWRATNPVRLTGPQPYPARTSSDDERVAGFDGDSIEVEISLSAIETGLRAGDQIGFRIFDVTSGPEAGAFPAAGRGSFEVPILQEGLEIASISDQLRDDHGPGSYTYLIDHDVPAGTYDLEGLMVREFGPSEFAPQGPDEVQFEVTFREPLANPWSAPKGFSHQTIDIYIDGDPGFATGSNRLLPGRVAAIEGGSRWDYAVTVDGWSSAQYVAGAVEPLEPGVEYAVLADRRTILITVDRAMLPDTDPGGWHYGVAVIANQAFPTRGIHEFRRLAITPGRFHLGGGSGAINDPLIMDLLHPAGGVQEELLTPPTSIAGGDPDQLAIDNLGRLPLVAG